MNVIMFSKPPLLHLPVWDVNVDRIAVVQQTSDVRHRRVQQPLALIQAALLDGLGEGAWVSERIQLLAGGRQRQEVGGGW